MNEQKKYSVKELASILGCSLTAVNKKILPDPNNPEIKRYRQRFNVVIEDGKTLILLTDAELEEEKRLSKGFKNVSSNVSETSENVIDVDYTAESQTNKEDMVDKILNFTNVYLQRYETLQTRYYNLLNESNNQIKLLTDSESKTQKEFYEISARCKELEEKNKMLKRYVIIAATLLIIFITLFITFRLLI